MRKSIFNIAISCHLYIFGHLKMLLLHNILLLLSFYNVASFYFIDDGFSLFSGGVSLIYDEGNLPEGEGKLILGCELICIHVPQRGMDIWSCQWQPTKKRNCHIVTREMMRNAKTTVPEMPYLMNATSSPTFTIGLVPDKVFVTSRVSTLEDGFLQDYPNLFGFFTYHNAITKIATNTFRGVDKIRFLQIDHCFLLTEVEAGAFDNMTSLEILFLYGNSLTTINSFKNLLSLKQLFLYGNNLTTIKANTFKNLSSLFLLNLMNNSIVDIHKDAFKTLAKLKSLTFAHNKISYVHVETFRNLRHLSVLGLNDNMIESIPDAIFKNLPYLAYVSLTQNPLSYIPQGMFNYSNNVDTYEVGCSYLDDSDDKNTTLILEKGSLATKAYAQQCYVIGCISNLKPLVFEGVNTKQLFIVKNKNLKTIRQNIFYGAKVISKLYLFNNSIEIIEKNSFSFSLFHNLLELDLSSNKLKTLQNGTLANLHELNALDLSSNYFNTIASNFFRYLSSLIYLYLEFNQISQIQDDAFYDLGALKNLSLHHNQLSNLSEISFRGLINIEHLDLSWNKIKTVSPHDFKDILTSAFFQTLLLHQNEIWKIEAAFDNMNLDLLDLSHNALTVLSNSFKSTFTIKKLILSNNNIERIAKREFSVSRVSELLLANNQIKDISFIPDIGGTYQLNFLDVSFNQINEVSDMVMKKLLLIKNFNITSNPWKCSCEISDKELMNFLSQYGVLSCCPKSCQCSIAADKSVFIDCNSKKKSSLPPCLPYQSVELDYFNNSLKILSFIRHQENITSLNLKRNIITVINGSTLGLVRRKLIYLNLRSNLLKTLPKQIKQFSKTTIYLEGNRFLCNDCSLVNILKMVKQSTPQDIICDKNDTIMKESILCLLELTIIPFGSLGIVILIIFMCIIIFGKWWHIKRLGKKYKQKLVLLNSREAKEAYERECAILRTLDHQNVIKFYSNWINWIPFVTKVGNLFLENVDCTLNQALKENVISTVFLNMHNLTRDLLSAMDYLHSREHPIYHTKLSLDTIFLQLNIVNQYVKLKVGNFSQASIHVPTESTNEETPLLSSTHEGANFLQNDLQAIARIVFALLTGTESHGIITMEDMQLLPDVEFAVLILALQEGMSAAEGLQVPPFHSALQKKSLISELNALFKGIKNQKKSSERDMSEAELNACLVIGGKGAWNKHFELEVLREFALGFNGYNIISFIDLLRIIRNILEHGYENPTSMMATFKTKKPQPGQILVELSKRFPFFYLHSFLCFFKFFKERSQTFSQIYMKTLEIFENFMNSHGLANGSLVPLQERSLIFIHYKSLLVDKQEIIMLENTKSFVKINDIFPDIKEKMRHLISDISMHEVFIKHHNKILPNPYTNGTEPNSAIPDFTVTDQVCIPEGSTIEILHPRLNVQLQNQTVTMNFKSTDNVKVIKGQAVLHLPPSMRKTTKFSSISVTLNGKKVKDKERIVDLSFSNFTFIVRYSHPSSSLSPLQDELVNVSATDHEDSAVANISTLFHQPDMEYQVGNDFNDSKNSDHLDGSRPLNV